MKNGMILSIFLLCGHSINAQKTAAPKEPPVSCNGTADELPGKYYDHTQPKYPTSLKASSPQIKAAMLDQLIAFEKLEEKSRTDFSINGCVLRTSFSTVDNGTFGSRFILSYAYQLAAYQNVCHVVQHIVKTVDEYRTVFRVTVNSFVAVGGYIPAGTGDFYLTDKGRFVRYEIPVDAVDGPDYVKMRNDHPSRASQYVTEAMVLTSRSDDYKNKHNDFLKIINGDGYVENWMGGARYDKPRPKSYKWIDRHYMITKPGMPLLIPVSRRQYLEDMLEYFEIEKANFNHSLAEKIKRDAQDGSEYAKKRMAVYEADKVAYPILYEAKIAKVKKLLATQKSDWLSQPAIIPKNTDDGNQRLESLDKLYNEASETQIALYNLNPEYFKVGSSQSVKPLFIEVQFRYEQAENLGFSERLFNNFLKNYDLDTLRKMLQ